MVEEVTDCGCHGGVGKRCLCRWWPLLIGPAAMILVYIVEAFNKNQIEWRAINEDIALIVVGISVVGFGIQAFKYKQEFQFFMLTLCAAFFCREWHFAGTSNGIYIVLGVLAAWFFKRRQQIDGFFKGNAVEVWLWTTFGCYALSQVIARRVFEHLDLYIHVKLLPREEEMHVYLEETMETTAHILMIITCLVSWVTASRMVRNGGEVIENSGKSE